MAAAQQLQKVLESTKGENGRSLKEHLTDVFLQLIFNKHSDPISKFEAISKDVKSHGLALSGDLESNEIRNNFEDIS
jgi:hypothetical protein